VGGAGKTNRNQVLSKRDLTRRDLLLSNGGRSREEKSGPARPSRENRRRGVSGPAGYPFELDMARLAEVSVTRRERLSQIPGRRKDSPT